MKYLLLFALFTPQAYAQSPDENLEIEVGAPRDCVVLGKKKGQDLENVRPDFHHMVMDCLAPQEEEVVLDSSKKPPEVVSQ